MRSYGKMLKRVSLIGEQVFSGEAMPGKPEN